MCHPIMVLSQKELLLRRLSKSSLVCDKPVKERLAGFFGVIIISLPGEEGRVLESTSEAKSDWPGEWTIFDDFG